MLFRGNDFAIKYKTVREQGERELKHVYVAWSRYLREY